MAEHSSYLDRLKFDPKLWNSLQAKYLTNFRLVLLLILSIVIIGITNFFTIPRRLNPEVKIPIVVVNTLLPGASPADVESLLTVPIEDKLLSVEGLDTITSVSRDNVSSIVIQFVSTVDADKARDDVQSLVDSVGDLPEDAQDPTVTKVDFEDQPVWTFALITNHGEASLMKMADILKDKIEDSSKIDRVVTAGFNEQEIQVIIDPVKMNEYSINPFILSQTIARATNSYPAGNINTNTSSFSLTIDPDIISIDSIRQIRLTTSGKVIHLSDIAQVVERSKQDQRQNFYATKDSKVQPTVQFFVYKTASSNIDTAEADARKIVTDTLKHYDNNYSVVTVMNTAEEISKQFTELIGEFRSTIILVFLVLLLFLGLRQAVISSLTIPLTFLSAISILNMLGITLNFLTLFAILIALGLLIDDTIVTVAAMTRYYSTGKFTSQEAGLLVWRDFIVPLWSTTITTIWAFVPLLLATGIIGEFIRPIPIVVTSVMLSSTSIAVLITLPLMMVIFAGKIPRRVKVLLQILGIIAVLVLAYFIFPKSILLLPVFAVFILLAVVGYRVRRSLMQRFRQSLPTSISGAVSSRTARIINKGLIDTERMSTPYMNLLRRILNSQANRIKTLIAIIVFAVVAYLLLPFGLVKNEFFPKTDEDIIYVNVDLPAGTKLDVSRVEALNLMDKLKDTESLQYIFAETGTQFTNFERSNNTNSFLYTLRLYEDRKKTSIDIAQDLREEFKDYSVGKLTVQELTGGPPAGADVQITLLGEDLDTLDTYANDIMAYLEKKPGVTNVNKSIESGTGKIVFVPDYTKLADAGLTADSLALWMRTYASGFTLDSVKFEENEKDVVLRISANNLTPEELGSIQVPTQNGQSYPLLSLGKLQLETNPTVITRENGKRSISVYAGVLPGYVISDINNDLLKHANSLNLPDGYEWKTGGVNEENNKSVQSIIQAMGLSFLLILITMIIEFNSFRQALLTMMTIPLAISGVFYIFGLTGTPLSFPALIGILALFGIVVTNAIVVVEKINDNRKEGMPLKESIIDASGSRLEPVLLTSLTTIFGLLPITISDPLWRGLGGAIISGLLFSGIIKLFFVPVVYYLMYRGEEEKEKRVIYV